MQLLNTDWEEEVKKNRMLKRKLNNFRRLLAEIDKRMHGQADTSFIRSIGINGQILNIVQNHFTFKVLNTVGHHTVQQPRDRNQQLLAYDGHVSQFIVSGYANYQSSAIRRLVDEDPNTSSLITLIEHLKKQIKHQGNCITREVYNAHFYLEYKNKNVRFRANEINNRFNEMCKLNAQQTKNDQISEDYFDSLVQSLKSSEITTVKQYTNKYVAHTDRSHFDPNKQIPLEVATIEKCHSIIFKVFNRIKLDFFDNTCDLEPMTSVSNLITNLSHPFSTPNNIQTIYPQIEEWDKSYRQSSNEIFVLTL
jgi:hypothetical protein